MKSNFQFFPLPTAKFFTTTTLVVSFVILLGFFPQSSNGLECMTCDTVEYEGGVAPATTTVAPTDPTCIAGTNSNIETCAPPNDKSCIKVVSKTTPKDGAKPATFIGRRCTEESDNPGSLGKGCYATDAGKVSVLTKKSRSNAEMTGLAGKAGTVTENKFCLCDVDGCNKEPGLEIVATANATDAPATDGPAPGPGSETPDTPEPPAIPDKSMILSVGPKIILALSTLSLSYVYIVIPK